ncbi:hypothetical protein RF55_11401 [Lasius niger]|uniref:Uncharacterized protein n=1 Tax=Lasius niger TaxID=67767 RepID=A0A0J7N8N5_LASNI|nr:hypothetical protein RF55_11401 [Lasius niger]
MCAIGTIPKYLAFAFSSSLDASLLKPFLQSRSRRVSFLGSFFGPSLNAAFAFLLVSSCLHSSRRPYPASKEAQTVARRNREEEEVDSPRVTKISRQDSIIPASSSSSGAGFASQEDRRESTEERLYDCTALDADDSSVSLESTMEPVFAALDPTPFDPEDRRAAIYSDDVDSILVATTSLEPFRCRTFVVLDTRPQRILRYANRKLTAYLEKREEFRPQRPPSFSVSPDDVDPRRQWYEFRAGSIDKRDLYVLFQPENIRRNRGEENRRPSGRKEDGPLRTACEAFIRQILFGAIQDIPENTLTARGGAAYVEYDVSRTYRVMASDYDGYVREVSQLLSDVNILETCHMHCVRFYMCEHGLRLDKNLAAAYLADTVDVAHGHLDVLQIHRADNIYGPHREPVFVRLNATGGASSLKDIFDRAETNLAPRSATRAASFSTSVPSSSFRTTESNTRVSTAVTFSTTSTVTGTAAATTAATAATVSVLKPSVFYGRERELQMATKAKKTIAFSGGLPPCQNPVVAKPSSATIDAIPGTSTGSASKPPEIECQSRPSVTSVKMMSDEFDLAIMRYVMYTRNVKAIEPWRELLTRRRSLDRRSLRRFFTGRSAISLQAIGGGNGGT